MPFESPNARSKTITVADGPNTGGTLNQHPSHSMWYSIGVAEDKGSRRTMEDSHSFVVDFDDIRGQGYFGLFDGHAGKHAAEWCGQHFHEELLKELHSKPDTYKIPNVLNTTFHAVDKHLSQMAAENKTHSGCTAVAAFLRIEDEFQGQSFLPPASPANSNNNSNSHVDVDGVMEEAESDNTPNSAASDRTQSVRSGASTPSKEREREKGSASGRSTPSGSPKRSPSASSGNKIRNAVRSITSKLGRSECGPDGLPTVKGSKHAPFEPDWNWRSPVVLDGDSKGSIGRSSSKSGDSASASASASTSGKGGKGLRRVLYAANVGDARAVLCRNGEAIRLTYDHKGSDAQESKRITDAGGFVVHNRVNGVLAVTRSLGDSAMKEFVVGAPYTTETELGSADEFLIIACDGLWDVTDDQEAVDLVRDKPDAQQMAKLLLEHALIKFSSDNVTVMVIRFKPVPIGSASSVSGASVTSASSTTKA